MAEKVQSLVDVNVCAVTLPRTAVAAARLSALDWPGMRSWRRRPYPPGRISARELSMREGVLGITRLESGPKKSETNLMGAVVTRGYRDADFGSAAAKRSLRLESEKAHLVGNEHCCAGHRKVVRNAAQYRRSTELQSTENDHENVRDHGSRPGAGVPESDLGPDFRPF